MVESDLGYIPRGRLKKALRQIRDNPKIGKPLGHSLKGCRSHDVSENRIIYKNQGKDSHVIAIGRRRAKEVHATAEKRLKEDT